MSKLSWLALPLALYLVWAGVLFLTQRRLIFPRHLLSPAGGQGREAPPPGVERVGLETSFGEVEAWYIQPGGSGDGEPGDGDGGSAGDEAGAGAGGEGAGAAPAVIFAHGNAELARDWVGAYRSLARRGPAVLLVEYPGYGDSAGSPSEATIREAMAAGWDHLAGREAVDESRIVALGRSVGGGAVGALARERSLAALVLQSTFTGLRPFARRMLLPGFLVRDAFETLEVVRRFDGPVLVFHGRADEVIPYEHGQRLAEAAQDGRLVTWPCGHNDCPRDWEAYLDTVVDFLREEGILAGG